VTLSAFLSSLQVGFKTLIIQKRSSEVQKLLEEVKDEFGKYSGLLDIVSKKIKEADSKLDQLITTRTNAMTRKLKNVVMIEEDSNIDNRLLGNTSNERNAVNAISYEDDYNEDDGSSLKQPL